MNKIIIQKKFFIYNFIHKLIKINYFYSNILKSYFNYRKMESNEPKTEKTEKKDSKNKKSKKEQNKETKKSENITKEIKKSQPNIYKYDANSQIDYSIAFKNYNLKNIDPENNFLKYQSKMIQNLLN
jgi:hypothetical protein